jgi:glutaminyl-peptide cyclotransferase
MLRYPVLILSILVLASCGKGSHSSGKQHSRAAGSPEQINYSVVKTYPHDRQSFTEGLIFHDNELYESTGSPEVYPEARSIIGIVDLKKGKTIVKAEIDKSKYFGEGILFLNCKLYQLTYKNQTGFIYDAKSFRQTGTFTYSNKEGWGMTTDGHSIIMSDGTNMITYWDPADLHETRKLNVTFNGSSALYMNELEYIDGFIYANVWTTNSIVKIDPNDGKIAGIMDLTSLFLQARKENPASEATNGIAYDSKRDRIYVTGKFWPYIYQIRFEH